MNTKTRKATLVIERTDTGFSGYFKEIDGIATVGDSIAEIKEICLEALEMKIGSLEGVEIDFAVDLEQFFDYYKVINKTAFADYIGMNKSLFRQYVSGLTNLSDSKLLDISKGLHKLADDFSDIVLVK